MKGTYQRKLNKTFYILASTFIFLVTIFSTIFNYTYIENISNKNLRKTVLSRDITLKNSLSLILNSANVIKKTGLAREWAKNYPDGNDYYYLLQLYKEIGKYGNQLNSVEYKISITLDDDDSLIINNEGSFSKKNFFTPEFSSFTEYMWKETLTHFKENTKPILFPIYENDNLTSLYYIEAEFGKDFRPIFIYEIPISKILGETEDYFIFKDNEIIADSKLSSNKTNSSILNKITGGKTSSLDSIIEYSTFKQTVFVFRMGTLPFSVGYKYSKQNPSILFLSLFIIILSLVAILILFVFHQISTRLYQPIKNTVTKISNQNIKEEQIDEFKVFQDNFNTLNNMNKELEKAILEKNQLSKQKYFRDLIFGIPTSKCPLSEEDLLSYYCVAYLELVPKVNEYEGNDWFIQLQKNNIYLYIQNQNIYRECYAINTDQNTMAIIFQCENNQDASTFLIPIYDLIDQSCALYISVSNTRKNISQISKSYKESQYLADYKYTINENTLITKDLIKNNSKDSFFFPLTLENKFIHAIISKKDYAISIFDELIEDNLKDKSLSPDTRRNFIYSLIGTQIRVIQELKTTPQELIGHNFDYPYLYSNWTSKKTIDIIRKNFEDIINSIKDKETNNDEEQEIIDKMKNYIYENYNQDIMLIDIAEHCNISIAYSSTLFKKLSNTNFKEFLNKYRIKKACEIIHENPEIKTKDLSALVGFNSSNSFIRVFKKELEMTPKSYAELI